MHGKSGLMEASPSLKRTERGSDRVTVTHREPAGGKERVFQLELEKGKLHTELS
jgi:hypothetical protein